MENVVSREHDEQMWWRISDTIRHFMVHGYKYRNVPWTVPHEINMATCPDERYLVNSNIGEFVGSAEQSFLYLDSIGKLGKGKFVTCTPCFRNDEEDYFHQKTFMKVELYDNDFGESSLEEMVELARDRFSRMTAFLLGDLDPPVRIVSTPEGFDIEINGIEVGSYGERSWGDMKWLCGTALAEPRFTRAITPKWVAGS